MSAFIFNYKYQKIVKVHENTQMWNDPPMKIWYETLTPAWNGGSEIWSVDFPKNVMTLPQISDVI